jgi:2-oxo-4-hydroxy-4-carboxy--5-ureidoimidazoline (OHCU) decarboxylase
MSPASNPALPAISSLSTLPVDKLLQVLDTLFEPSPELHDLVAPLLSDQSFSSYDSLMDAVRSQMLALAASRNPPERQTLYGILGSHPRLGASSAAAQAHLSELSRKEQAKINAGTGPAEEEAARLSALNKEYEETYPGLRYVYVFRDLGSVCGIHLRC